MEKPYWLVNRQAAFPALTQDRQVDVAVIGAGITGASVCYWLADKCRVVLLEEDIIAGKASGRNAGFLLSGTSDYYHQAVQRYGREKARTLWKITRENQDLLETHIFQDDACDHKRSGGYLVATSDQEMGDIRESVALLREDGFPYQLIDAGEINTILSSKGFFGAALNERDGEVNPVKLVDALVRRATSKGTELFEKTRVKGITAEKEGLQITTDQAVVRADFVVLATNAYTPLLDPYFQDKIMPTKGQMLATKPLGRRFSGVFYANYGYEYWRQAPDGRVLAGGFRELDFSGEQGYGMITTKHIQDHLEQLLKQLSLEFKVEKRWSGIMGFSRDRLPMIGPMPGNDKLLVALGYSGHGLGFGFYAGRMIAELILHGQTENLALFASALSPLTR